MIELPPRQALTGLDLPFRWGRLAYRGLVSAVAVYFLGAWVLLPIVLVCLDLPEPLRFFLEVAFNFGRDGFGPHSDPD